MSEPVRMFRVRRDLLGNLSASFPTLFPGGPTWQWPPPWPSGMFGEPPLQLPEDEDHDALEQGDGEETE